MREDVVVEPRDPEAGNRRQQAHRHDEDDRERQRPALILRRQHEKHEHGAEHEDGGRRVAGENLLQRQLRPFEVHARREQPLARRRLAGERVEHRDRIARTRAGQRIAGEFGRWVEVVMRDDRRAARLPHRHQSREGHHLAGGVADFEPADVALPHAELLLGLGGHLPVAAEGGEVVDVGAAQIDLQRLVHVSQIDALGLHLGAIDLHEELRLARPEPGEEPHQPRLGGGGLGERCHRLLQSRRSLARAVANLEFEATGVAHPLDRWRRECDDLGLLDLRELFPQCRRDRAGPQRRVDGATGERLEQHEHSAGVWQIRARQERIARHADHVGHAGGVEGHFREPGDHRLRPLDARAVREHRIDHEKALVLFGDESDRHRGEAVVGEGHQADVGRDHDDAQSQQQADDRTVGPRGEIEEQVEEPEKTGQQQVHERTGSKSGNGSGGKQRQPDGPHPPFVRHTRGRQPCPDYGQVLEQPDREQPADQREPGRGQGLAAGGVGMLVATEQDRRQGRGEAQRIEGRDHGAGRDRKGKLAVELAADAGDEGRRHEHGTEHQCDRDHRTGDFRHRPPGRLAGGEPLRQPAFDVLHNHNGVVDDDADRQHKTKEREIVEREPKQLHDGKRAHQRHRHGDHRDDRGPPRLEKHEHHDEHQHDRFEERLVDLVDAFLHELRRVVVDGMLETRRKFRGELLHRLPHTRRGRQGIRSRPLKDGDRDALATVEPAGHVVALGTEFDPADVGEPDDLAAGHVAVATGRGRAGLSRLHDHVGKLVGRGESSGRVDRQLEIDAGRGWRLAQLPRRHLHVLLAESANHVDRRHAATGELVGIEPDPHRVVTASKEGDVADAVEPRQRVLHLEQRVVGEVELVVAAIGRDEIHAEQDAGGLLLRRHPLPLHLFGELGQCHRDPVLREHLRLIDVGAERERDIDHALAVVGALRRQIEHVLDAVHFLFDRRGDSVGHHLRARARIESLDRDRGGSDIGILRHRQTEDRDGAEDQDHDGDHRREDRPVDEEMRHEGLRQGCIGASVGRTTAPSRARCSPAMTTRSEAASPSATTRRPPSMNVGLTVRCSMRLSDPTTATYFRLWSVPIARSATSSDGVAAPKGIRTRTNMPGAISPSGLARIARQRTVPVAAFTATSTKSRTPRCG